MTRRRSAWTLAVALMLAADGRMAFAQAAPPAVPPAAAQPNPTPPMAMPPMAAPPMSMPPPPQTPATPPPNLPPPPVKGGPAGVAAVINGQTITRAELAQDALQLAGNQALRQIIINTLVTQAAQKQGVTVTPAEVDARLAQVRQQVGAQYPGGFDAYLAAHDITMETVQQNLRTDLLAEKMAGKNAPVVHRAHIHYLVVLTADPNNDPSIKPHTQAAAQAIIAKAQADLKAGQSFESVVAQYSEDPGKTNGGEIGIIGPESAAQFDPTFVKAALALKPGEVTATPVYSPAFGYFLLKAVSTSEHPGADQAMYAQSQAQDSRASAQTFLESLLKTAKITNYYVP